MSTIGWAPNLKQPGLGMTRVSQTTQVTFLYGNYQASHLPSGDVGNIFDFTDDRAAAWSLSTGKTPLDSRLGMPGYAGNAATSVLSDHHENSLVICIRDPTWRDNCSVSKQLIYWFGLRGEFLGMPGALQPVVAWGVGRRPTRSGEPGQR